MKKQTKQIIVVIIGAVILIALLGQLKTQAISGTSTLSISQAELQSSNPYLSGKVWLVTFASGGLGQHYYGTITPQQVETVTSGESRPTKQFTVKADYQDSTCNYAITRSTSFTPIYNLQRVTWTYIPYANSCSLEEAKIHGLSNVLYVGKYLGFTCFAIGYNGLSLVGSIENPNKGVEYTLTLDVDGVPTTRTINTLGSTSGSLGDYAYVVWDGNLDSGISCASQSDYKSAYVDGQWRIIDNDNYIDYKNKIGQSLVLACNFGGLDTEGCVDTWLSAVQTSAQKAKISTSFGTIANSTQLDKAVIKVTTASPLQFPVTTMYIKATTIGIYTPVPNFQIVQSASTCFRTGSDGLISTTIKNNGETGTYNLLATCNSPFVATANSQGSLNGGETKVVNIFISASASQKTTGTCTVTVESTNPIRPSAIVNVCVDPLVTCTSTVPFCGKDGDLDAVYRCSADGATKVLDHTCGSQEYCDAGVCKSGGGTCKILDESCGTFAGKCCTGLICDSGKCVKSDATYCSSCFDWASNIFKSEDKKCAETTVIETHWYNPLTWINFTGLTEQSTVCPIYLILLGLLAFGALIVILLMLGKTGGLVAVVLSIFRSISGSRKGKKRR